ncbi:MAG: ATP-binding protein [Thermomicrobiales bacterium]|nr:ATP-binding protein [Thermomicrobiales bacterium]
MKRISDVIKNVSIPINTGESDTSSELETYKCAICKDRQWLRVDAEPGHPNFGRLFPCECYVREREDRLAGELFDLSQLQALSDMTFANFDESVPGIRPAYDAAVTFARNPAGWIFFHGSYGVGKTHLAVAIANEVLRSNTMGVYFRVVPDLLDQLRATFDPEHGVAYDERFQQIRNAHLLILDDLGTEQTTPWAREKLYQLFNHRYNEQLPTVVTSNQDYKHIDQRILSRMLDTRLSQRLFIEAEDYRLTPGPR